jgi:hypothetical protein
MKNYNKSSGIKSSGIKSNGIKSSGIKNGGDNHSQSSYEKKKFRGPFSSNVMGTPIVNAITGVKYAWTVGSYGENYLWKVMRCTDEEPKLYFYDSPEQYEEFRRVRVDTESKVIWHREQQRIGNASE